MRAAIPIVLALLLALEGLSTAVWIAHLAPMIAVYDWLALVVILLRALVGAFQLVTAWLLVQRALPARTFAEIAFLASAVLTTVEIGFDAAPTDLFPSFRWPFVALYWLYALACVGGLRAAKTEN